MQKKKIRSSNSDFQIHDDPSQPILLGQPSLFGAEDSSCTPVFLPVVFLIGVQH
jgi:hypothetical protein